LRPRLGKEGSGLYRRLGAFAFTSDLPAFAGLPPPAGGETLTLFMERAAAAPRPGGCEAMLLLRDSDLPPAAGAAKDEPVIVFSAGERFVPGADSQFAIAPGTPAGFQAVWEDRGGRFRKETRPQAGEFRSFPSEAARFYLLWTGSQREASRFIEELGESFAAVPRPSFLPAQPSAGDLSLKDDGKEVGGDASAEARAIGDNIRAVPPGSVRPGEQQAIMVCSYDLASGIGDTASAR
jgi:hypothetical protein